MQDYRSREREREREREDKVMAFFVVLAMILVVWYFTAHRR